MHTASLQTVGGPVSGDDLGLILPHEHLFTDLRGPSRPDYAQADPQAVVGAMTPFMEAALQAGATALVECSTIGVGRNISILQALNEASRLHIIAPTGVYREAYVPDWMQDYSAAQMTSLWVEELTEGIEGSGIKAGFIKIAVSDEGIRPVEERTLKAAAEASKQTGAVVASHTPNGDLFRQQWKRLEEAGLPPDRFIWVHANLETDSRIHLEAAELGVFVEFDGVGADWQSQPAMVDYVSTLLAAGYKNHILLSHDAGWFQPGRPGGEPEGGYRGFTALVEDFLPALQAAGVSEEDLHQITHRNPIAAYGLPAGD